MSKSRTMTATDFLRDLHFQHVALIYYHCRMDSSQRFHAVWSGLEQSFHGLVFSIHVPIVWCSLLHVNEMRVNRDCSGVSLRASLIFSSIMSILLSIH